MISSVLFMCLTNTIDISSSNMNNTSSSSNNKNNKTKETTDGILDIIFDYTATGDDELTLRFQNR